MYGRILKEIRTALSTTLSNQNSKFEEEFDLVIMIFLKKDAYKETQ